MHYTIHHELTWCSLIQKISKSTKMAIITCNIDKRYFIVVMPCGGEHAKFHGKQWKGLAKSHIFIGHTFSTAHACFSEFIRSLRRYKGHPLFFGCTISACAQGICSTKLLYTVFGHSNKMICFWSPARMYFWKFPKHIIIVPCTEAHQR